jgi:O-succinylbenzoic acid--CoA ligase
MNKISPENFLLQKQFPSSKAIYSSEAEYTYDELRKKVQSTANYLKGNNISSDDRIGIVAQNDFDYVVNILALWQLGAIPVPINIRLTETEVQELLERAKCSTVLVQKEFLEKVEGTQINTLQLPFEIKESKSINVNEKINLDDPAVIHFTSGSTDKSKGVILSFKSLYNSAVNSNQLLRYTRSDKWLASLPFYHIGGFSIITRSILLGLPLIIPDSLSIENIKSALKKWQPTFISLVSVQLNKIVDEHFSPNPELKNCLIGGGFAENDLLKNASELGWPVNVVYGSTETASFVTALLKDEIIFKPNSVGRAVPTNNIFIKDVDGNEQKPFEIGEIVVQSNSLMSGYLDKSETNEIMKNGFYYTHDLGYMDDDGFLFITGRKNYLISTGGENVNPAEVEKALLDHPLISEAAVFPLKDKEWGEIIAASIIVKQKLEKIGEDDIRKFLREKLSSFKIPKKIYFEEQLPKTDLGKVEKSKLIERYKFTSR